ncbi:MAG: hypothetical protein HPY85_08505 [Anaerolineae bacterium]|jgi:hypothetical protein|nr:hypothetical protein [Anaerolineae bacterium]
MAMTTREEVQSALRSLDFSVDQLRNKATLATLQQEISTLEQNLDRFGNTLKDLRERGYVFDTDLESQVKKLQSGWNTKKFTVSANIRRRQGELEKDLSQLDAQVRNLQLFATRPPAQAEAQINRVRQSVDTLASQVDSAANVLRSAYAPFNEDVRKMDLRLKHLDWMMTELHQATFHLLETEALVEAAEVRWYHDGKEDNQDPKGILYLTDQRLIFELHDKIVKKKVLFIATESEIERKLMFECPVSAIAKAEAYQEGLLKGEDHMRLTFGQGGPYDKTQFRLFNLDNEEFCSTIRRVQGGEFLRHRTEEVAQEVLERVKNAPSECPACGGAIQQKVLRGQDTITCEYCGNVIRL